MIVKQSRRSRLEQLEQMKHGDDTGLKLFICLGPSEMEQGQAWGIYHNRPVILIPDNGRGDTDERMRPPMEGQRT